jgi:general secretion pathway protein G
LVVTRVRGRFSRRHAFTLVEILVVVAIIGILASIVLKISGFASGKSDRARALSDMERIKMALEEYKIKEGRYYTGGANATDAAFSNAVGPFVRNGFRITDPWGRNYMYQPVRDQGFRLWSTGPNAATSVTEDDVDSDSGSF